MEKIKLLFCFYFFCSAVVFGNEFYPGDREDGWRAGVAKGNITPKESMWMRGYASRNRPADGTLHELWAKALVLVDARGEKAVLVTLDLCTIQKGFSDQIRDRLQRLYNLNRSQIILSLSHTHSGPTLRGEGNHIYTGVDNAGMIQIERYSEGLEDQLAALV